MSNVQLERAVMFPICLLKFSKKQGDQFLNPTLLRVLANSRWEDEMEAGGIHQSWGFSEMLMIPGGRFLLTTSETDIVEKTCIKLWNLGAPGSGNAQINHTSAMTLPGHVFVYDTAPTPDGSGILIVVALEFKINVYQIFPLSPTPTFMEIATVRTHPHVSSVTISGSRIFCITRSARDISEGGHILVWDYVKNLSATLFILVSAPSDIYPYGDHLVTCHQNALSVWTIPPLKAKPPVYGDVATDALGTQTISPWMNDYRSMPHQIGWRRGSPETHPFYVYNCAGIGPPIDIFGFGINRSWIPLTNEITSDTHPTVPPSMIVKYNHPFLNLGYSLSQNTPQKCHQAMVLSFALENNMMLVFTPTPGSEKSDSSESTGTATSPQMCFLRMQNFESAYAHFCPATGRVCALTKLNGEIRILDYA